MQPSYVVNAHTCIHRLFYTIIVLMYYNARALDGVPEVLWTDGRGKIKMDRHTYTFISKT